MTCQESLVSPRKGSAFGFLLHSPAGREQPEGSVASAQTRWWISEHGSWGPQLITLPAHRDPRGAFLRSPQYPLRFLWLQPWIVLRNGILSCSHFSWLRPETIGASWFTGYSDWLPTCIRGHVNWAGPARVHFRVLWGPLGKRWCFLGSGSEYRRMESRSHGSPLDQVRQASLWERQVAQRRYHLSFFFSDMLGARIIFLTVQFLKICVFTILNSFTEVWYATDSTYLKSTSWCFDIFIPVKSFP